jgi:hypothetical protein
VADEKNKKLPQIPYGSLNNIDGTFHSNREAFDQINNTALSSIRNIIQDRHTRNVLINNTEFVGIALKVLKKDEDKISSFNVFGSISNLILGEQNDKVVRVYVYIPEIQPFPVIDSFDDEDAIKMHPLCVSNESIEEPTVGSLIRVTFRDVNNLQGGVYLGPLVGGNKILSPGSIALNADVQTRLQAYGYNGLLNKSSLTTTTNAGKGNPAIGKNIDNKIPWTRPYITLTTFSDSGAILLEDGWEKAFNDGLCDALSIRLPAKPTNLDKLHKSFSKLIELWDSPALTRKPDRAGWIWGFMRDAEETKIQAEWAIELVKKYNLKYFYINAEKDWGGMEQAAITADPEAMAILFATIFRDEIKITDCKLGWNGYSWTKSSPETQERPLTTLNVVSMYDMWTPMIYGYQPKDIEKNWREKVDKWRHTFPNQIINPMIGSGRFAQKLGPDSFAGFWEDVEPNKGYISLIKEYGLKYLNIYYGGGSTGMLFNGNKINKPILTYLKGTK